MRTPVAASILYQPLSNQLLEPSYVISSHIISSQLHSTVHSSHEVRKVRTDDSPNHLASRWQSQDGQFVLCRGLHMVIFGLAGFFFGHCAWVTEIYTVKLRYTHISRHEHSRGLPSNQRKRPPSGYSSEEELCGLIALQF